ncbi:nuclear transport factor 2 family protein [Rhodobacterales bacterium HKCCE2091]|nr:nuclear transport factor 2 family protein [Rhodobacterales bacterium HKCCE2091]
MEALTEEVRYLRDCEDIRQAMYAYARGVDRADLDLIGPSFHDDAEDDHGNFRGDKAAVMSALKRSGENPAVTGSMHHLGNMLIDLRGDVADVETYFVAYQRREEDGRIYTRARAGRYLDRFEKRDGRWRVKSRRVVDDWSRLDEVVETAREVGADNTHGARDRTDASYRHGDLGARHRD